MRNIKSTLTFADAQKRRKPTAFSVMVKPLGSICNMECGYCYYLDKANLYSSLSAMDDELLEEVIYQQIESNDVEIVNFCWHGGEPLLAGLDFYRRVVELQKLHSGDKRIENSIQTNGLLVSDEWCDFFVENNFLVGISIDGPEYIHDAYRNTKAGKPTFNSVMQSIERMSRRGVEYNTLSVISNMSEGHGVEVYKFMKSIGSRFMQFLPMVEYVSVASKRTVVSSLTNSERVLSPESVSALGYGQFMLDIFNYWVTRDVGSYFVQMFDAALAKWMGLQSGLCVFEDTCGDALVIEHNGDVYSCDHFVYPEHKLGNVMDQDLIDMYKSNAQFRFGINKRNNLPSQCLQCEYYFACRGECPKHRFDVTSKAEKGLNSLCGGFKLFFKETEPYMLQMKNLLEQGQPAFMIMPWANSFQQR